jgi:hypothetical protein
MADVDLALVRTWAQKAGLPVGTRGRIRPEVISAYVLAHGGQAPASPPKTGPVDESSLVARPLATPGVAESYDALAGAVAKAYVPGADRDDLTEAMIEKARRVHAAIVAVGSRLQLYRDHPIPTEGMILLDWRVDKPTGSR